jgi:hypothetical protein
MRLTQMPSQNAIVPTTLISQKIFFVRGTRIMLDAESRPPVCSSYKKPEQSSQTKRQPLSCRFHVSTHPQGITKFGVPVWNLKTRARWPSLCSLCFHGARCSHAFQRAPKFAGRSRKRRDHANLRSSSRWKSATTRDFRLFLRRFAACLKRRFQRRNRSDFTPDLTCPQSLPTRARQV